MLLDHIKTRILGTFEQKILKMNSENKLIKKIGYPLWEAQN